MNTLIINTYAGSLLLGANAIKGSRIIGSFEDCGFGAANTKANRALFTEATDDFQFVDHIKDWPDLDLTETIILAHPPCAAFSQQNTSKAKRGTETDAFNCTRKVLRYGMTNGAAGIAIESVPGALHGAWHVYNEMAQQGGYHVYRIMKNSLLFGVPQFRERFWAVLIRKDLAQPAMTWRLSPHLTTVRTVLDPVLAGATTPIPSMKRNIDKFVRQLGPGPCRCGATHSFPEDEVRAAGLARITGYKRAGFSALIQPKFFPTLDKGEVCRKHVSPFTSAQPSVLAPGGYSPVLLATSLWVYEGQPVPEEGYKVIMGFPAGYAFPKDPQYSMRCFLSKGVCPPVATWILDNVRIHLGLEPGSPFTRGEGYVKVVMPGHIASFRPGRNEILERLAMMWEMGCPEDDELIELRDEENALQLKGAAPVSTGDNDSGSVPSTVDS